LRRGDLAVVRADGGPGEWVRLNAQTRLTDHQRKSSLSSLA
jgi:hypothetical protein